MPGLYFTEIVKYELPATQSASISVNQRLTAVFRINASCEQIPFIPTAYRLPALDAFNALGVKYIVFSMQFLNSRMT
jgi:hypothetical protein